jgi:hypothetical protein
MFLSPEEQEMDADWKPRDSDLKTVLEAHGLLLEGLLLDEALGLTSLYADRIRQVLGGDVRVSRQAGSHPGYS